MKIKSAISKRDEKEWVDALVLGDVAKLQELAAAKPSILNATFESLQGASACMFLARDSKLEALSALVRLGCDVDAKDRYGWSAAMHASKCDAKESLAKLFDAGADLDAKAKKGWTAAMAAANFGSVGCLAFLAAQGCDLYAKSRDGHCVKSLSKQYPSCEELFIAFDEAKALSSQVGGNQIPSASRQRI